MEMIQKLLEGNALVYIKAAVEISILALLIYTILHFLRGTRGASILTGILTVLMILAIASDYFKLEVMSWLLNGLWGVMAVAIIVILQPELRRAFAQIGSQTFLKARRREAINELVAAILSMASKKRGALIIIEQDIGLKAIANSGIPLDAKLSSELIETIFYTNTPLHDGGIIIRDGRVVAACCILPLSTNEELLAGLGTRHRAGLGISEESDALAIIVSEETGRVSLAHKGNLKRGVKHDRLERFLDAILAKDSKGGFAEIIENIAESGGGNGGFSK